MVDKYEKLSKEYDTLYDEYTDMVEEYRYMLDKYNALLEFLYSAVKLNKRCAGMSNIKECPKGTNLFEYSAKVYQSILDYLNK